MTFMDCAACVKTHWCLCKTIDVTETNLLHKHNPTLYMLNTSRFLILKSSSQPFRIWRRLQLPWFFLRDAGKLQVCGAEHTNSSGCEASHQTCFHNGSLLDAFKIYPSTMNTLEIWAISISAHLLLVDFLTPIYCIFLHCVYLFAVTVQLEAAQTPNNDSARLPDNVCATITNQYVVWGISSVPVFVIAWE